MLKTPVAVVYVVLVELIPTTILEEKVSPAGPKNPLSKDIKLPGSKLTETKGESPSTGAVVLLKS